MVKTVESYFCNQYRMTHSFPWSPRPRLLTLEMRHFRCKRSTTFMLLGAAMFLVTFIDLQLMCHYDNTLFESTEQNSRRIISSFQSADEHRYSSPAIYKIFKFQNKSKLWSIYRSYSTKFNDVQRGLNYFKPGFEQKVMKLEDDWSRSDSDEQAIILVGKRLNIKKRPLSQSDQLELSSTVGQLNDRKYPSKNVSNKQDFIRTFKNKISDLAFNASDISGSNHTLKKILKDSLSNDSIKVISTQTLKNVLPVIDFSKASGRKVSTNIYKNLQSMNAIHLPDIIVSNASIKTLTQTYENVQTKINMSNVSTKTVSKQTYKNHLAKNANILLPIEEHRILNTIQISLNLTKMTGASISNLVNIAANAPEYQQTVSSVPISKHGDFNRSRYETPHLMRIGSSGRLGNNIFQLGALIGISRYHGYTPQLSGSHRLRRVFKINISDTDSFQSQQTYTEKYAGIFDPEVLSLKHVVNWTMIGYYQSWKYFLNSISEIRGHLHFTDKIVTRMLKLFPAFIKNKTTVGVHVRRGDMNTNYERKRGYSIANEGYIKRAMHYYRQKYLNPIFVICSDDIIWCQKYLNSSDTVFFHFSAEVDLAALAHCSHSIITSGTYGWWGAFLAGGETIYFKNYPRRLSWLETQYKREDYYLPYWRGLE